MNTANLQLEGLLLAMCGVLNALRDKGLLSREEIEAALDGAARTAREDQVRTGQISLSNVEAMLFPIRFLSLANRDSEGPVRAFSKLAAEIGRSHRG